MPGCPQTSPGSPYQARVPLCQAQGQLRLSNWPGGSSLPCQTQGFHVETEQKGQTGKTGREDKRATDATGPGT